MIDYSKSLVIALKTILPTHYEMTLTSGTQTPCISYMERNNYSIADGDSIANSRISFQVKVWADTISDIQKYSLLIDSKLRPMGFQRTSATELFDNESAMIQKIMVYEANATENF